jgi:hypothetical protein
VYFTATDRGYVTRVLALHESLAAQVDGLDLLVYCFDEESAAILRAAEVPGLHPVPSTELERAHPELAAVRPDRSGPEYVWTAKAAMAMDALARRPDADVVAYVDGDLFFFSDPGTLFADPGGLVYLTPHRFSPHYRQLERTGRYNAGFLGFRRSPDTDACLRWWHARCLEWCHDRLEPGRYADQHYLDELPGRFPGVRELDRPVANVGPWNWSEHVLSGAAGDGRPLIDGEPIVFAHFHGVRVRRDGTLEWAPGGYLIGAQARRVLLPPYAAALRRAQERVVRVRPGFRAQTGRTRPVDRARRVALVAATRTRRRFPALARVMAGPRQASARR